MIAHLINQMDRSRRLYVSSPDHLYLFLKHSDRAWTVRAHFLYRQILLVMKTFYILNQLIANEKSTKEGIANETFGWISVFE